MRNAIRWKRRFTQSVVAGVVSCLTTTSMVRGQATGPLPYRPGIDVTDYAITLDLPQRGASIEGRAVLSVRRWAPIDTLVLDLVGLRVDSVLVDEKPVTFARTDSLVRVPIASVVGDSFSVTVRYTGEPKDGLIVRTDSVGRWTAFGDNWPNRARNWIPSIDHPSDKATVTWTVRAPSERRVVANGELMEETPLPAQAGSVPRTLTRSELIVTPFAGSVIAMLTAPGGAGVTVGRGVGVFVATGVGVLAGVAVGLGVGLAASADPAASKTIVDEASSKDRIPRLIGSAPLVEPTRARFVPAALRRDY